MTNLRKVEKRIRYRFNDAQLLMQALTHSSYAQDDKTKTQHPDYERLEFLGDAVLEIVISEYLFLRFPEMSEGELTRLRANIVCESVLVSQAQALGLGEYLILGKGEDQSGGRHKNSILADSFEAVAGAIYLDGGLECAKAFIIGCVADVVEDRRNVFKTSDYKTYLQELIQKTSQEPVTYKIIGEKGPDHDKIFTVQAFHSDRALGCGSGKSKKEAEQNAAFEAYKKQAK